MKTICVLVLVLILYVGTTSAQEKGFLDLEGVHRTASILLSLGDADRRPTSWATGVFLYNYVDNSSPFLLTAKHVFDVAQYVMPMKITKDGTQQTIASGWLPLRGADGTPKFLTYKGVDIALLPVPKQALDLRGIKVLSRSNVTYSDSVLNGDQVLLFGAAVNPLFDKYEGRKQFLVTSGTIALQTDSTYVVDQTAFHGMSGGLVFRREIAFRPEGDRLYPVNVFTAIGLVAGNVPELTDKYTQVIKVDYVDSILYKYENVGWGSQAKNAGAKK